MGNNPGVYSPQGAPPSAGGFGFGAQGPAGAQFSANFNSGNSVGSGAEIPGNLVNSLIDNRKNVTSVAGGGFGQNVQSGSGEFSESGQFSNEQSSNFGGGYGSGVDNVGESEASISGGGSSQFSADFNAAQSSNLGSGFEKSASGPGLYVP